MRNFVIFFKEREGTSALVRLLDKFDLISVVHQENNLGWEPFDRHNCGSMSLGNLNQCLDIIYGPGSRNIERLNRIYTRTAKKRIEKIGSAGVVGFKMRFRAPNPYPFHSNGSRILNGLSKKIFHDRYSRAFKNMMFDMLKKHSVMVFIAVRQDVLRLALSKYHGDGTGNPGHMQFKLAAGAITREEIGTIKVDLTRLEKIICDCEALIEDKRRFVEDLKRKGIQVHPVFYEEFLTDKYTYLERMFGLLELQVSRDEISAALSQEEEMKKVHSDDISEFVENHEEVMDRFGNRFVSWC